MKTEKAPSITTDHQIFLHKVRLYYSICAVLLIMGGTAGVFWYFYSSLDTRKTMALLSKAKTLQQIDRIIADSKHQLSDEKMAEIYSQCAVNAFNRKDYTECKKLLYRIIDSQAHIEYISSAKLELAYIFRMEGNFGEETSLLKSIINNPSSPSEIRIKAEKLLEQYEK
ncbi:MAG: hypothetical protein E7050_01475 [Lentisphaerae bacterium]|nr:hypothetical protein [Lentisphaerota bacterium]